VRAQLHLYVPAIIGVIAALLIWFALARIAARRGLSRWRPVLLCLPLLLIAAGYGLFWWGFFSSPAMAVQLHAVRLTLEHAVGAYLPWITGGWLAASLGLLLPLLKRPA
jgi:hypothetical protein